MINKRNHVGRIRKLHVERTTGYFKRHKIIAIVENYFYWPTLKKDVVKTIFRCRTCQLSKERKNNTCLYMSLPILYEPWKELSMDFVLCLPKIMKGHDYIIVLVERFLKMTHFITCFKTTNAIQVNYFLMK